VEFSQSAVDYACAVYSLFYPVQEQHSQFSRISVERYRCLELFQRSHGHVPEFDYGNAGLITKVNVPKYIYPFSRTLSSLVNFMFSLLPLLIVMLITRTSFHLPILLLPFPIFCLFIFALGIGLMLATSMVFFRDTQFLWGVVSTLWMYLTPIFYDVGIIPARFLLLYKMNPLYHLVRTFRIILIQGVSPSQGLSALPCRFARSVCSRRYRIQEKRKPLCVLFMRRL
jgi:ABC-type polysaccharide/polyol phosphate export permease